MLASGVLSDGPVRSTRDGARTVLQSLEVLSLLLERLEEGLKLRLELGESRAASRKGLLMKGSTDSVVARFESQVGVLT